MEIIDAIKSRRSVRNYDKQPVEDEKVRAIIEAGMWAPSACDAQGWKFIILDDTVTIKELYANGGSPILRMAKQAVVVLYHSQMPELGERDKQNYIKAKEYHGDVQSAAACMQNMVLRAYDLGVSTCWMTLLPTKEKLRELLNIPDAYDPIGIITLGYPMTAVAERPRKFNVEDVISYNAFGRKRDE